MTPFLVATANGLHALATVVFVGYYLLLSLLYLPALTKPEAGAARRLAKSQSAAARGCMSPCSSSPSLVSISHSLTRTIWGSATSATPGRS